MGVLWRLPASAVQQDMPYAKCPKCGHAPLPEDQALPAACGACGLVLTKYGTVPPRPVHRETDEDAGLKRLVAEYTLYTPNEVSGVGWQMRVALLGLLAAWTLWIWSDTDIPAGQAGSG